ncbi:MULTISPECIES: hypothetical protein [unclassified Microbacterium]|uniref:hypothetical protein n=1 Tax=unclassified Microbacterium TaxID=2609290 RepID=UPI0012FB42A1|nr:hypothetical protein [Microbacterium sp. MAH-37]MVQ41412.1 hypothetical protein [Microbacterium sp. MAH-37]
MVELARPVNVAIPMTVAFVWMSGVPALDQTLPPFIDAVFENSTSFWNIKRLTYVEEAASAGTLIPITNRAVKNTVARIEDSLFREPISEDIFVRTEP